MGCLLPAVELDNELLFDGRVYLVPARGVEDPARVVVVVGLEPRGDGDDLLDGLLDGLEVPALLLHADHVVGPQDGGRDVVLAPVEEEVPVGDELPRLRPARREAHPVDDVVHPELHEPQQVLAADPGHPGGPVVGPPELLLRDPVVPPGLLLLEEPHPVLRLPLSPAAVLPRWIGLLLEGVLPHGREHHPRPPVSPAPWTRVTRHCSRLPPKSPLTPAPLGRPATVVRLARDVLYGEHLDAHGLEGPGRHVPARAMALDLDVHATDALVHRLVRHALGRHLGGVGGALAAPLEPERAGGLPGYDVALLVRHRDDGVVERALYVDDAGRDVLANPPARATGSPALLTLPAHLLLLPPPYGRLRTLALAGVRLRPLPAHGEAPAVPDPAVGPDVYEPPDVLVDLAPEIALDLHVLVDVGSYGADLALREVADLGVGVNSGLGEDLPRRRAADPVDVGQPYLDPLLPPQVYARYPRHALALPLLVPQVRADHPH